MGLKSLRLMREHVHSRPTGCLLFSLLYSDHTEEGILKKRQLSQIFLKVLECLNPVAHDQAQGKRSRMDDKDPLEGWQLLLPALHSHGNMSFIS